MRILFTLSFLLLMFAPVQSYAADTVTLQYRERPTATNGYTIKYGPPYSSVRLAGIGIPETEDSKNFMNVLFKQTSTYPMRIDPIVKPVTRYSTPYAEVFTANSQISLQKELIIMGLVRFFPFGLDKNSPMIKELENAEQFARETKKGLWAGDNTVLSAENPFYMRSDNKLALVTGAIVSASEEGKMTFINFGADPKTDFTVQIPAEAWAEFTPDARKLLTTPSVKVLVRGTMSSYNGPMIMVKHPAQIEILP